MEQKQVIKKVVKKPIKKVNEKTIINTIKKNWKNILLIVLVLFSFSKCVSSCSKQKTINKLNYQIEQQDSILTANNIEIDKLSIRLDDAQLSINSYKGIATGNQQDLVNKVQDLTQENKELNKKVNRLTNENLSLKKEIDNLKENNE